ncbi:MAG: TetR/AcrR family transcriptional regulator [Solirubrobacteraceae bacterium]|nr:TetR/AcrR family transcriptional regulator [Patulibacter sp.]
MSDPTRIAILDAAEAAFKLETYNQVSVSAIATDAHASVGAIYHHFGDKGGLRSAVNERVMARLVDGHLRPPFETDASPIERLTASSVAYVKFFEEHTDDFILLSAMQHDPRESEHAQRFSRGTLRHITSILGRAIEIVREAQEAGEIRRGNPGSMVVLVWSSLYGMCALAGKYPGPVLGATGQTSLTSLAVGLLDAAVRPEPGDPA